MNNDSGRTTSGIRRRYRRACSRRQALPTALARHVRVKRDTDRWYQNPVRDPIVQFVAQHSRPDQTVFVWGFRAETYLSARRYPASRYVYTVYPAGVVPWFQGTRDEETRRVLARIAEDEARHAELAWRTVSWALRVGGPAVRDSLRSEARSACDRGAACSWVQQVDVPLRVDIEDHHRGVLARLIVEPHAVAGVEHGPHGNVGSQHDTAHAAGAAVSECEGRSRQYAEGQDEEG